LDTEVADLTPLDVFKEISTLWFRVVSFGKEKNRFGATLGFRGILFSPLCAIISLCCSSSWFWVLHDK